MRASRTPRTGLVLVAALAVAGAALLLSISPEGQDEDGASRPTPAERTTKRTRLLGEQQAAEAAGREALAGQPVRGTGTPLVRADRADEDALAQANRELLLETRIADLEQAAALAEADGHDQRAALMHRRIDAMGRMLDETRAERDL